MPSVITPKEGEQVLLTLRKNPNKFGKNIFITLIMASIAVLGFVFFATNNIIASASLIVLLLALIYAFYYFLIWFYDIYIITNIRIICVNQKSLFTREFVETDLAKIDDVTYSIRGVFATIFKFGTVTVRTSTGLNIELTDLSDPDEIQEMIKNLADVTHKKNNKEMSAQELIDFINKNQKR